MTDDLLARATRSLRDETSAGASAAPGTIDRVVVELGRRQRRRRFVVAACAQLVVALVGVGAWAGASGRLDPVLTALGLPGHRAPAPTKPPVRHAKLLPAAPTTPPAPTAAPTPDEAPPATVPPPVRPAPRRAPIVARAVPPVTAPPAAPSVPPAEPSPDELFAEAHDAQFARRDWDAALAGWDRYLALGPSGRFVLEARYNRALVLWRLGRRSEAAEALRPFAAGDYGGYRQDQARALLDRLGSSPP